MAIDIDVQYPAPGLFKEPIEQIVAEFSKRNPDIKVNLLGPQQDYEQIVQHNLRSAITNTLPDVAIHGMNRQRVLVERGIAQPIDNFIKNDPDFAKLGITEKSRSVGLVGGKQYGIGLAMSTPVIYYNADLVKSRGRGSRQLSGAPGTASSILRRRSRRSTAAARSAACS